MSSSTSTSTTEGDFRRLYEEFLAGRRPFADLLRHDEFLKRARRICRWLARGTRHDPDALLSDAYLKAARSQYRLRPDNTRDEKDFFRWFFVIVKNLLCDRWRRDQRLLERSLFIDHSVDDDSDEGPDFDLVDEDVGFRGERCFGEFMEFIRTLPDKHRRALMLRLENYPDRGCPYEEVAKKLAAEGFGEYSGVTIRAWLKDSLRAFFGEGSVSKRKTAEHRARRR